MISKPAAAEQQQRRCSALLLAQLVHHRLQVDGPFARSRPWEVSGSPRTSPPPQWPGPLRCARWSPAGSRHRCSWAQSWWHQWLSTNRSPTGHDWRIGRHGGLQQVGMEGQHGSAIARGALRKHRQHLVALQGFLHGAPCAWRRGARCVRCTACRQRWPACQSRASPCTSGFGDEAAMPRRAITGISSHEMVGHQHDRAAHRRRPHPQRDTGTR